MKKTTLHYNNRFHPGNPGHIWYRTDGRQLESLCSADVGLLPRRTSFGRFRNDKDWHDPRGVRSKGPRLRRHPRDKQDTSERRRCAPGGVLPSHTQIYTRHK